MSASLLVTGDDFGLNSEVNEAIERDHQAGLLTQASLMVNESGVDEAVRIARRNPSLCVGLHLSLCCGRASASSGLGTHGVNMIHSPAWAGLAYALDPRWQPALEAEIETQFSTFAALGFPPVYWDGHTHLHLHPAIWRLTLPVARRYQFKAVRLVEERKWAPLPIIFRLLSRSARRQLGSIHATRQIIGLTGTGQMTTHRIERAFAALPEGLSEWYYHPGAEKEAIDPALILEWITLRGIRLTNWAKETTPQS